MKSLYYALNMAISMFTIIPLPKYEWDESSARHTMKLYPFIGLIIGGLWYVAALLLTALQVTETLTASILLAIPFLLTGFLHLDGFMDVCDALLSRRSQEEKIRILKDSRVGAFAVISLVLLLICQFSALQTLLTHQQSFLFFILIPIISRSLVGYFLITKETISESYLGKLFKQGTGRLDLLILSLIYFITFLGSYLLVGILGIAVPLFMGIAALLLVRNTQKQLGGFNGDVAGYILVLCEFIGLLTLGVIR